MNKNNNKNNINIKMNDLIKLHDWLLENKQYWFNASSEDDVMISNKWSYLYDIQVNQDELLKLDIKTNLGYIILNDQIIRHKVRAESLDSNIIKEKLKLILEYVKVFYQLNKSELEGYNFCFTLLVLRHTNDFNECTFVLNETWKKIDETDNTEIIQVYKNYLKATYERMGFSEIQEFPRSITNHYNIQDNIEYFLERFHNIIDYQYLDISSDNKSYLEKDLRDKINVAVSRLDKSKKYILSISGGVDSMVLSWALTILDYDFVMVHINYANRDICEREKSFLREWAQHLNKRLFYKDIYEINRPKCMKHDMRNIYENYTRDIRYNSYIQVKEIMGYEEPIILLGHNHDDCIENILTNIATKNKYDNLYGMSEESIISFKNKNIIFGRPMLSIPKSKIYEYANKNNIPFLFDSTPSWSQRGQIRDTVRPCLERWNSNMINGLEEVTKVLTNTMECVNLLVDEWINNKLTDSLLEQDMTKVDTEVNTKENKKRMYLKIEITQFNTNKIFWEIFLRRIGITITSKGLDEMIRRFELIKRKYDKLHIKHVEEIQISKNNKILYWKTYINFMIIRICSSL